MSATTSPLLRIREEVLCDSRYPVHRIADQLLPYLQILIEQFHPERVILFGSYAYGDPTPDSDVDLLVVKPIQEGRVKDKVAIRRAWWPLLLGRHPLPFDLLLKSPEEFANSRTQFSGYHAELLSKGLRLA